MTQIEHTQDLQESLLAVTKKFTLGLWVTHSSYAIFLILLSTNNFLSNHGNITIWLVKTLPLLIFIPAFIKRYPRTYSWLCFAILPYFIFITPSVFETFSWFNWVQLLLTVVMFNASMMTSRWLQQQNYLRWQINSQTTASHISAA